MSITLGIHDNVVNFRSPPAADRGNDSGRRDGARLKHIFTLKWDTTIPMQNLSLIANL
jgi:hypothetical protein